MIDEAFPEVMVEESAVALSFPGAGGADWFGFGIFLLRCVLAVSAEDSCHEGVGLLL